MVEERGWNPWRALRARQWVRLVWDEDAAADGGGYLKIGPGETVVGLDPKLGRRDRSATLGHELVHEERGGGAWQPGCPESWRPVVARDEAIVDDEVARRMVPLEDLRRLVELAAELADAVTALEVAEEYDVSLRVAERALKLLLEDWSSGYGQAS